MTSSFERFDAPDVTSSDDCGNALPVTLVDLSGVYIDNAVQLHWETATEVNHAGFELERSADGQNFEKIAWKDALGTNGLGAHYLYTDKAILKGHDYLYYRLKQVDNDGTFVYSKTIAVALPSQAEQLALYPNPTTGTISINLPNTTTPQQLDLVIYNNLGQEVQAYSFDNVQEPTLTLRTETLPEGIYTVNLLLNAMNSQKLRFIKQ